MCPVQAFPTAVPFLPPGRDLASLRAALPDCRGCDLWRNATQAVPGEGDPHARIVFVGEQPGDQEDRIGRPFVGPAGRVLDRALVDAGIERAGVFVTNAVKHFKWERVGGRRLHKKPREGEIDACLPWLEAEMAAVQPRAVVCLGVSAARALFGRSVRLMEHRGRIEATPLAEHTLVTVHPSSILRLPVHEERERAYRAFVADLGLLRPLVGD